MKNTNAIPAIITKIETMAGGKQLRLKIDTQEVGSKGFTREDFTDLMSKSGEYGYLIFVQNALTSLLDEIKDLPPLEIEKGDLTPSQRVRNTLFVLYRKLSDQNKLDSETDFDQFYKSEINKFIESIKDQLRKLD